MEGSPDSFERYRRARSAVAKVDAETQTQASEKFGEATEKGFWNTKELK